MMCDTKDQPGPDTKNCFASQLKKRQFLIPQLVLYINNHAPPLIDQRWIAPINVVSAAESFNVEDE